MCVFVCAFLVCFVCGETGCLFVGLFVDAASSQPTHRRVVATQNKSTHPTHAHTTHTFGTRLIAPATQHERRTFVNISAAQRSWRRLRMLSWWSSSNQSASCRLRSSTCLVRVWVGVWGRFDFVAGGVSVFFWRRGVVSGCLLWGRHARPPPHNTTPPHTQKTQRAAPRRARCTTPRARAQSRAA